MNATKESVLKYTYYDNTSQIPQDELLLIENALKARENAYAPYSDFLVGAALMLEDGQIIIGNNQENAAYPSGLCAERVAIYHAGAVFPDKKILKLAVCGGLKNKQAIEPVAPCGACRQAILEYAQKQGSAIEVIFVGTQAAPAVKVGDISDLLPFCFGKNFLA